MRIYRLNKTADAGIRLWLDDNRNPQDPVNQQKYFAQGDELLVKTPAQALTYLSQGKVSFISFDCDLGMLNGEKISSKAVANWIEEAAYNGRISRLDWNVHSENPVDKDYVIAAMVNAGKFWDRKDLESSTVQ